MLEKTKESLAKIKIKMERPNKDDMSLRASGAGHAASIVIDVTCTSQQQAC